MYSVLRLCPHSHSQITSSWTQILLLSTNVVTLTLLVVVIRSRALSSPQGLYMYTCSLKYYYDFKLSVICTTHIYMYA